MATTSSELALITRELNGVRSAGQARAAIGSALIALSGGYEAVNMAYKRTAAAVLSFGIASDAIDPQVVATAKKELDSARTQLEAWYDSMKLVPGSQDYSQSFNQKRSLILRAYTAVAGAEGIAGWNPGTSNWSILKRSLLEAPGVFTSTVVAAAKEVATGAGNVAGSALGGIFSGLGPVSSIVLVAGVVLYLKGWLPGSLLGGRK